MAELKTSNIKKISDLTAISSADIATDDLLLLQDVSASALKKVTASDIIKSGIDDTTASTSKTYSSSKVDKITRYQGYIVDISDMNDLQPGYSSICRPSTLNIPTPTDYMYGLCTCYEGNPTQGAWKFQVFRTIAYDRMYIRRNNTNQGWSSWQRLVTESDLTPTTTKITFASGTSAEPSSCWYTVSGKICIVQLTSYTPSSASGTVANDLPKAKNKAIARLQGNSSSYCLIYVNDNGTRLLFANGSTSQTYTGQIMYTIAN